MNTTTIKRDLVTIMITPTDQRRCSVCYDLSTPTLLGRFLQDNQFDPETGSVVHGTLGFVRGLEIEWVQQVLAQLEAGHDFWERV
jgi:hypothetical protein